MMYNYIKKWKGDAKKMLLNFKMETLGHLKMRLFLQCFQVNRKRIMIM